jgi:hypothetical protein
MSIWARQHNHKEVYDVFRKKEQRLSFEWMCNVWVEMALTVIACPCLKGILGVNSSVGDQVCPNAITRSKPSSCKFGDSS